MPLSKYEKIYRADRDALGAPTKAFVDFFESLPSSPGIRVLDLGCGQGRDALFIARLGHNVIGVDLSPAGIEQLLEDAAKEGLDIEGVVADLTDYDLGQDEFDVVLVDRTLHMMPEANRLEVTANSIASLKAGGYILIADEKKNLPAIEKVFEDSERSWLVIKKEKGFLFLKEKS